jgi:hypothetical protein
VVRNTIDLLIIDTCKDYRGGVASVRHRPWTAPAIAIRHLEQSRR